MSISSEISRLQTAKEDLAASIEAKGVTVPAATKLDGYPALVDAIQTGSGGGGVTVEALSVTSNGTYTAPAGTAYSPVTVNVSGGGGGGASLGDPVRFFDYDGTLLHSYSASDFAALTEMPSNPSHAGLIAQGWNWSLADAKTQVTAMGACNIGQMYITDDGKTRVYLEMPEERRSPYLALCPNGTVTVDWGDGSVTDTLTGTSLTSLKYVQHTYPSAGSYVMTLTATSGKFAFYSNTSNATSFLRYATGTSTVTGNRSRVYLNAIRKIELGEGAIIDNYAFHSCYSLTSVTIPSSVTSIGGYAFQNCYSLTSVTIPSRVTSIGAQAFYYCYSLVSITIPDGVTSIGTGAFHYCTSLTSITIPDGVTSIGAQAFYYCQSLASISIPDGVTSIGSSTFYNCYSLASITIPDGVTSIGTSAFTSCYGLAEIHLKPTTPPTVANSNAWTNLNTDCIIYVPAGTLSAYTSATNYPSSSTYTYVEESA